MHIYLYVLIIIGALNEDDYDLPKSYSLEMNYFFFFFFFIFSPFVINQIRSIVVVVQVKFINQIVCVSSFHMQFQCS